MAGLNRSRSSGSNSARTRFRAIATSAFDSSSTQARPRSTGKTAVRFGGSRAGDAQSSRAADTCSPALARPRPSAAAGEMSRPDHPGCDPRRRCPRRRAGAHARRTRIALDARRPRETVCRVPCGPRRPRVRRTPARPRYLRARSRPARPGRRFREADGSDARPRRASVRPRARGRGGCGQAPRSPIHRRPPQRRGSPAGRARGGGRTAGPC